MNWWVPIIFWTSDIWCSKYLFENLLGTECFGESKRCLMHIYPAKAYSFELLIQLKYHKSHHFEVQVHWFFTYLQVYASITTNAQIFVSLERNPIWLEVTPHFFPPPHSGLHPWEPAGCFSFVNLSVLGISVSAVGPVCGLFMTGKPLGVSRFHPCGSTFSTFIFIAEQYSTVWMCHSTFYLFY